jgi:hypothetical protein
MVYKRHMHMSAWSNFLRFPLSSNIRLAVVENISFIVEIKLDIS